MHPFARRRVQVTQKLAARLSGHAGEYAASWCPTASACLFPCLVDQHVEVEGRIRPEQPPRRREAPRVQRHLVKLRQMMARPHDLRHVLVAVLATRGMPAQVRAMCARVDLPARAGDRRSRDTRPPPAPSRSLTAANPCCSKCVEKSSVSEKREDRHPDSPARTSSPPAYRTHTVQGSR